MWLNCGELFGGGENDSQLSTPLCYNRASGSRWNNVSGAVFTTDTKAKSRGEEHAIEEGASDEVPGHPPNRLFDVKPRQDDPGGTERSRKDNPSTSSSTSNPPDGIRKFDPLRDYPRSEYNDITTGKVRPRT